MYRIIIGAGAAGLFAAGAATPLCAGKYRSADAVWKFPIRRTGK